jgi:hypothetical protein
MMHKISHFAAYVLNNPWTMGFMAWCLVFVPIIGMWAVHHYGWQHWEPFARKHK